MKHQEKLKFCKLSLKIQLCIPGPPSNICFERVFNKHQDTPCPCRPGPRPALEGQWLTEQASCWGQLLMGVGFLGATKTPWSPLEGCAFADWPA